MTESDLPKVIDNSIANAQGQQQKGVTENSLHADAYLGRALGSDDLQKCGQGTKCFTDSVIENLDDWKEDWRRVFKPEPSKEDVKKAKEELNGKMSPLVSEADRNAVQGISNALLDGNPKALSDALSAIKDPEQRKKYIEELNHNLKEANAGISLAVDSKGRVLVYKENGKSAVEFDPKTGEMSVRPISVSADGTVVLQPGEVLNGNPSKVLSDIAQTAVNDINGPLIAWNEQPSDPRRPYKPFEPKPFKPFNPFEPVEPNPYYPEPKVERPIYIPSLDPLKPISLPETPMDPLAPWRGRPKFDVRDLWKEANTIEM